MTVLLRRAFVAISLVCVACGAALLVFTVNTLVEDWVSPPPPAPEPLVREKPSTQEDLLTPLSLAPLRRYLGLPEKLRQEVLPAPPDASALPVSRDFRLLGTMLGSQSLHSFASVLEGSTQRTHSVWLGGQLGGAQVVAIERTRVLVRREGQFESVERQSVLRVDAPRVPSSPSPSSSIRQLGPVDYELSRDEMTRSLADFQTLSQQVRVVPAFKDGVARGFKVFSIRPDSLFARLGLRNGDIVRRINGLSLESPEHALEAYTRLREASHLEVEVDREGQPVRQKYAIRG